ncbi:hypothetical protein [Azospirillum oryzae]|uniref:hypothetical protein n=1 Tax=Azospirillum oryzae TaxID=286727 RepID=UPI0011784EFD|nr:hypothetical protein [Azospirillum oryzae]
MMAMSMGTTPVDDGEWAFHVDLYDSSPAGGSASVPLRRFFTPGTGLTADPHKKFRWTDRAHGPDNAPIRNGSESAKTGGQAPTAAPIQHNSLQTKDFIDQSDSRCQSPAMSGQRLSPLNCGFQTEKSQLYDFCQGLPSPGAFWQEKGR